MKRMRADTEFQLSLEQNPELELEERSDDEIQQVNNMVEVVSLLKSTPTGNTTRHRRPLPGWTVV